MPQRTFSHTLEEHAEYRRMIEALKTPKRAMTANRKKLFEDITRRYEKLGYLSPQSVSLLKEFYYQHMENL